MSTRARDSIRRAYKTVEGCPVHYREAGDPCNPTLLLLHQSPSSSAMYEVLMNLLADDFYMLAPDTPGFGGSDVLPVALDRLRISDYARAIQGFLQAFEIGQCYIFGHHTGAGIAVQLESDFPGTAVAMALSGPTLLNEELKKALPGLASPIEPSSDGSHLQAMWQRIRAKDPQASLELLQREVQSALDCGDSYHASYCAVTQQPFAQQLSAIACPVLVFAGDEDPLYNAVAPSLELLQCGEQAVLPGGERTYVCERQADIVAGLLKDFFGRHTQLPKRD